MLTFVCVHWGSKYSADYVAKLWRGCARSVADGLRFVCLTDSKQKDVPWEQVRTPDLPLTGWWWKLYLFSREFRDVVPERFVFLDLDTVIVGPLDFFGSYAGDFAMLRDMYKNPRHNGSGVMLFGTNVDALAHVWDEFKWPAVGRNAVSGDQFWTTQQMGGMGSPRVNLIQNIWPGKVVSYKVHVNPGWRKWRGRPEMPDGVVPDDASVVCFHGPPMPERVAGEGWMKEYWK